MRNQSRLNGLSMFPQRRRKTTLSWCWLTQAASQHVSTNQAVELAPATCRRAAHLGDAAGASEAISHQSLSLSWRTLCRPFRHAGLAQSVIVAVCAHIAAEGMHVAHEGDRKVRSHPRQLGEITPRLVFASQLSQCRDENCVARPLEAWLRQSPQRKTHRGFIFTDKIFGLGHTREIRAHIRILRAEANC